MYLVCFHRYQHYCFRVENPVFRVPSRFLVKMSRFFALIPSCICLHHIACLEFNAASTRAWAKYIPCASLRNYSWVSSGTIQLVTKTTTLHFSSSCSWLSLHRNVMLPAFSRFSIRFVPLFRWLMLTPMCFSETKPIIQRQYHFLKCFGRIPLCVIPIIRC